MGTHKSGVFFAASFILMLIPEGFGRTESIASFGGQKQDMGTSLVLDDGKQAKIYGWQGDILLTLDESASTYSPDKFSAVVKNKADFGDCQPWQIDSSKLQLPDIDGIS